MALNAGTVITTRGHFKCQCKHKKCFQDWASWTPQNLLCSVYSCNFEKVWNWFCCLLGKKNLWLQSWLTRSWISAIIIIFSSRYCNSVSGFKELCNIQGFHVEQYSINVLRCWKIKPKNQHHSEHCILYLSKTKGLSSSGAFNRILCLVVRRQRVSECDFKTSLKHDQEAVDLLGGRKEKEEEKRMKNEWCSVIVTFAWGL